MNIKNIISFSTISIINSNTLLEINTNLYNISILLKQLYSENLYSIMINLINETNLLIKNVNKNKKLYMSEDIEDMNKNIIEINKNLKIIYFNINKTSYITIEENFIQKIYIKENEPSMFCKIY